MDGAYNDHYAHVAAGQVDKVFYDNISAGSRIFQNKNHLSTPFDSKESNILQRCEDGVFVRSLPLNCLYMPGDECVCSCCVTFLAFKWRS